MGQLATSTKLGMDTASDEVLAGGSLNPILKETGDPNKDNLTEEELGLFIASLQLGDGPLEDRSQEYVNEEPSNLNAVKKLEAMLRCVRNQQHPKNSG